ncbi:YecA family protein [Planctomycetota bacterium]
MVKPKWSAKVPTSDDLKGWKEADLRLTRRFADYLQSEDRPWSARATKRYFGDDNLEYFLTKHKERAVVQAYTAWCVLDYRPNKTSKTHAEKMLEQGLPEPEATLLRARMEAFPTLYRVADHNPKAGTIDLEDILVSGKVTVHDRLMSESIENNLFLSGRTFPVGHFHFIELGGPPLGPAMGMEAIEFLRDRGIEFTPEGLRRDAHKFGWLWDWIDEWQANWRPPHLCNTDGDDFVWHTASFSIVDPGTVRRALLRQQNIEYDDEEAEFIWVKRHGKGAKVLGGPVTMGRIELIGDELVLTVNSAKRLTKARKWLERIPGVSFQSVETSRWDERDEDRPMDERLSKPEPVEITPELAVSLQEMIDAQYMEWIDTALPILGGKTPRQACRIPGGRQQVSILIRTMPDPMGDASVRIPREAMLRELGLTTESLISRPVDLQMSRLPKPVSAGSPTGKVGRNDPCPCGSGRKYKKCCGR